MSLAEAPESSWAGVCAVAAEHAESVDRLARFPAEAMAALRRHGALGAMVPAAFGGAGLGLGQVATMCRDLGAACGSTAMIFAMQQSQVATLVGHHGDDPWQAAFLRRVAFENLLLASVTSEEGIGGRLRMSRCAVAPAGPGRFALAKDGSTISYGADADAYLITARRHEDADPSDQVLAVMPGSACRLEPYRGWDALGMRGTGSGAFRIAGEGEAAQILPVPFGEIAAQTMLPVAHILWGAAWLGIASDVVARCRAFIRNRQRSKPGLADPGLPRLGRIVDLLYGMDARLRQALRLHAAGQAEAGSVELMLLKTGLSDIALEIAVLGLQICGIAGYRNDTPYSLGRHLRDLQSAPLMVGNEEIRGDAGRLTLMYRPQLGDFTDEDGGRA